MNKLIQQAAQIPVSDPVAVISVAPVSVPAPGRVLDLELRISAPATGDNLPVIVLSHGHGPSLYIPSHLGYGPIADFWAAHGFVVIQPTHLNSKLYALGPDAPGAPFFWKSRVEDLSLILDQLDRIEAAVSGLAGRVDQTRIAAAGHSLGGQTAGLVLGAGLTDTADATVTLATMIDPRFTTGILLAAPGNGGADLSPFARDNYTTLNPDYSTMTTPALVVVGDEDLSPHLTVRGADWHADPYTHSPGPKALLTVFGGKHGLGGIAGYDAAETKDEDPDRLAVVQRLTWAWLRSQFYPGDDAWEKACAALAESRLGLVESK